MTKLVSLDDFRAAAQKDAAYREPVMRLATDAATEVSGKDRTLRFCFSDGSIDRSGDKIEPGGWDTTDFMANPVALWAHDSYSPPVGRAANLHVLNARLVGDIEFAPPETYDFADTIFRLVKGKFINAVSVGFMPTEWKFSAEKDRPFGIDFLKQDLLEISLCPVPCNPNALIEARAKGIDTRPLMQWAEKVLDEGNAVMMPRHALEEIFKDARTPHTARAKYRDLLEAKPSEPESVPQTEPAAGVEDGAKAMGSCGREKDEECGMKDPADCMIHAPENKTLTVELSDEMKAMLAKAGRRISAKSKAQLEEAMGYHESATKCIKDVLDDQPAEDDGDGGDPENPQVQNLDENIDPKERRLRSVRALKESLKAA